MQAQVQDQATRLSDEQIRDRVGPALARLGAHKILGAQLGELINSALWPHGTYRDYRIPGASPKLRTFVDRVLEGLVQSTSERQGNDSYYAVIGAAAPEPAPAPVPPLAPDAGRLWRTFVAVNSLHRIVFDESIGAVSVAGSSEIPEGSTVVPSATLAEHRAILVRFLAELQAKGRTIPALVEIEANYSAQSYPLWLKVLRAEQPPLDKEWGQFRQGQLVELFKTRLSQFQLSQERIGQLATELVRDHQQVVTSKDASTKTRLAEAVATEHMSAREKRAREALHRAIDRLSFEQIQQLQLPFGAMLPVLGGD